jgi:energy-coupling factor transporter ATP-binding protein EcfA2
MQIRRIEVRNFKKLGHVVVEGLEDGLNVLVGDNEAGKSTLLSALRAGLFEKHRVTGEVAARMLPYGQSVRPEVAIDFALGGGHWQLRKAFCQKPEAELIGPGERSTGDAVEERLAELFSFTPPKKGQSKPEEHQGVYGLLWVEQGGSHRGLGIGGGRDIIASALEREVGDVIGGEHGRALLAAAEERYSTLWDKRGNPKGEYKALIEEVANLGEQKTTLQAALAAHDEKVAALAMRNEALARHEQDGTLNRAAQSLTAAREALRQAERLEAALNAAAERLERCKLDRGLAAERKSRRDRLAAAATEARKAAASASVEAGEARAVLTRHEAAADNADAACRQARAAKQNADDVVRALEQAIAQKEAATLLVHIKEQLKTAEEADAKRRERIAVAHSIAIRKEDLASLEKLQVAADRARLQVEAASVQIAFKPERARAVTVEGEPHDAGRMLFLSRDAVLHLEGFGGVEIHPGGGVEDLREKMEGAAGALAARLADLGYVDIAAAWSALRDRETALQEAAALQNSIAALAPKGLDALRQSVDSQRLIAQRPVTALAATLSDISDAALAEAVRAQHAAHDAEQSAEAALAAARRQKEESGRLFATLAERSAGAEHKLQDSAQELETANRQASESDLAESLAGAEAALRSAEETHTAAKSARDAAEPEAVTLELKRAEKAEQAIRSDIETLKQQKRELEIELRALGRDGVGEQLAEAEGQLAAATKRLAARHAEAAASRLLYETLAEAEREAKDRWLEPVRQRVQPYLKLIQPDSEIVLNEETLEIEHLVRKDVNEPFQSLSVGAREQVAVITRLAMAELLGAAGEPSAIILDDALVNTDQARLERMHLVLHKAAESLQILVLTCRERDFLQLGAPIHRM